MRLINSKERNNQMLFISLPLLVPNRHLDINNIYSDKKTKNFQANIVLPVE